ncbi:hypothetical protein C1645_825366 [Glomus cerebriforme]|uniref:Uncharacterized protein n=1 Tax=Glomus cerebriforme TaxID=658196 RepID=A0A397SSU1_9GLOM|nr:hypothetical protein C1645_825366 [Glomus cerebriforme]
MSFRIAKKYANEKISLDNVNKKGCKEKELVAPPSNDLNDLLNNEEAQQSKSKGTKRGHKKKGTKRGRKKKGTKRGRKKKGTKRGRKKKQDMVAPPASKIIIDLLDDDSSTKDLNEDKQDKNSQNDDEFIFLTRMIVFNLRANNPIDQINDIPSNRLIPVLESRNEIK